MRHLPALLLCGLLAAAFGACAQEAYVTGGVGRSNWNFIDCGASGCDRNKTAWRFAAGYRFNRLVAAEAFYFDFGRSRSSSPSLDGELRGRAGGAQALLGWQFSTFELAGKIGLASVRADFRPAPSNVGDTSARSTHTEVIAGVMAAYRVTPQLALRFDLDIVTVALSSDLIFYSRGADVTTLLLGVKYGF